MAETADKPAAEGPDSGASAPRGASGHGAPSGGTRKNGTGDDHDSASGAPPAESTDEESSVEEPEIPGLASRAMPQLDDLYREVVLDHYRNPRGRQKLDDPTIRTQGFNPTCGDQVQVALAVKDDRIEQVEVECHGCSISVASGSMMADLLKGKSREEVLRLTEGFKMMMHGREPEAGLDMGDLEALEGVRQFPVRIKCALLAWTTLQEALEAFAPEEKGD